MPIASLTLESVGFDMAGLANALGGMAAIAAICFVVWWIVEQSK